MGLILIGYKRVMKLKPTPTIFIDPETGNQIEGYLPEDLDRDKVYRVSKQKQTGFGTLVKTDRLNRWMNKDWFREVK